VIDQHVQEEKEDELREIIAEKASRIAALEAENAALRDDKARLDRLEELTYGSPRKIYVGHLRAYRWHLMGNNYVTLRAAIDATREKK